MTAQANEDGFVMVEAIAALGVTAMVAAGLIAALGSAGARASEAKVRDLALRQAQSLVTEAMAPIKSTELAAKGELPTSRLSWTRKIVAVGETLPGMETVSVEVSWQTLQKKGVTRLEAYRISPP